MIDVILHPSYGLYLYFWMISTPILMLYDKYVVDAYLLFFPP